MEPTSEQKDTPALDNKIEKESYWKELVRLAFWALIIVVPFRIFIAQPFVVNGASMDPTFKNGEYLIVDQITYRFDEPKRGDILIFRYPNNPKKFFIKRLIGLPGEEIKIENGTVTVTNLENPEGLTLAEPYIVFEKKDSFNTKLKDGEFFVLGDNRIGSADSRMWGSLPENLIVGRPIIRLFPFSKIDILPGEYHSLSE